MKNYIPVLKSNKEDFYEKFDKPYFKVKSKFPIKDILFDVKRLSYNNPIYRETVETIKNSFDIDNWYPVLVDMEFYLLDGQHRILAAKEMGFKYIDIVIENTELLDS